MVLLCLVIAIASCATALAAEARDVYYQGDLTPLNIVPTFDNGYLVVYDQNKINVYAPDGSPVYSASSQVQSAHWAGIQNAAVDTDGTLVAAVEYCHREKHTRGGGIDVAVFDRATNQWRPVAGMPDGHLLGADGDNLVFSLRGQNILRWVPVK